MTPSEKAWPPLPTETEIYILPDGRIVFADLPEELESIASSLGVAEACALEDHESDTDVCVE